MATFFTSDTHFGDDRVLNLYPRPYGSAVAVDADLIRRWNAIVGRDDEIWHFGDFARAPVHAAAILSQLNGRKHLVVGNNDAAPEALPGWTLIHAYAEIERGERFLVPCHYPFRNWNRQHRGAVNLHGHSHGRIKSLPRQRVVGMDVRDYAPVQLERLLTSISQPSRRQSLGASPA